MRVITGLAILLGLWLAHPKLVWWIFGFSVDASSRKDIEKQDDSVKQGSESVTGFVELIQPHSGRARGSIVLITAYNDMYQSMGAGRKEFSVWENAHGMDSLGVGDNGEIFLSKFPVFSKVAWMFIDPVDLSPEETAQLADECERASARATTAAGREQLTAIRDLALKALEHSTAVRFAHP